MTDLAMSEAEQLLTVSTERHSVACLASFRAAMT